MPKINELCGNIFNHMMKDRTTIGRAITLKPFPDEKKLITLWQITHVMEPGITHKDVDGYNLTKLEKYNITIYMDEQKAYRVYHKDRVIMLSTCPPSVYEIGTAIIDDVLYHDGFNSQWCRGEQRFLQNIEDECHIDATTEEAV